jgi:hypothetical protein
MGNSPAFDVVTSNVAFADVVTSPAGLTTLRQGPTDGCIYAMKGGYTTTGTIFKICHASTTGIVTNDKFQNSLGQNYPNPATGKTQIDYTIAAASDVTIEVYDVTGRIIKSVLNSNVDRGQHTIELNDLDKYTDGSYFYKLSVKQGDKIVYTETKQMIMIK